MSGPRILIELTPAVSRCGGCGGWVWMADSYGCNTCRILAARGQ